MRPFPTFSSVQAARFFGAPFSEASQAHVLNPSKLLGSTPGCPDMFLSRVSKLPFGTFGSGLLTPPDPAFQAARSCMYVFIRHWRWHWSCSLSLNDGQIALNPLTGGRRHPGISPFISSIHHLSYPTNQPWFLDNTTRKRWKNINHSIPNISLEIITKSIQFYHIPILILPGPWELLQWLPHPIIKPSSGFGDTAGRCMLGCRQTEAQFQRFQPGKRGNQSIKMWR